MIWLWIGFITFVLVMLALDLGVFNRKAHVVSAKEAMRWVATFVGMGLAFNVAVYFIYQNNWMGIGSRFLETLPPGAESIDAANIGMTAAMQYLAGWLTEYALSVDNIFVIAMIFGYFKVPAKYQHRVLFWGIMGALIMRGIMIVAGVALVQRFEWVLYIFGIILIVTAIKMASGGENDFEPEKSRTLRIARRVFPVSAAYEGQKFFTRLPVDGAGGSAAEVGGASRVGKLAITPLFLVLLIVEVTDVIFAIDSIPAIIGITRDPFLVFTSNVFAIMGLRSLYFALSNLLDKFHYLKYSLSAVLAFVGVKMLLEGAHLLRKLESALPESMRGLVAWIPEGHIHIPAPVSLGVIVVSLAIGVVASLIYARNPAHQTSGEPGGADRTGEVPPRV